MDSLFACAERILCASEVDAKVEWTFDTAERFRQGLLAVLSDDEPLSIDHAKFPERPQWVDPRQLSKRKLSSVEGRIALLHSVAHIEFSAIQLAWDHAYRFRGLPERYYSDWLGVAEEEARHFQMIRNRLQELGADYGDLPVHGGLWSLACETAHDMLARMALVPRFMEARGLDVTPGIMERLAAVGDDQSNACLQVILDEEIGHVALGSHWFHWEAERRGLDAEQAYFELLDRYMNGQPRGPYNEVLRLQAGFSESELTRLRLGN